MDSELPNIIDSLLIDLDNLQLGADFTEEMTFTGFHNISHMTMSFRVECSPGFCGSDCTTTPQNNPRLATCQTDGTLTCTDNRFDPSPLVACNDCLYNLDMEANYDPITNCTQCLPGWDITSDCTSCIPNRDPVTNCSLCLQPDRFTDTDCSTCVPGWDSSYDCSVCLTGRNISTDCTTCIPGYSGEECVLGEYTMV